MPSFPKIAVKNGEFPPRGQASLENLAPVPGNRMHLPVNPRHVAGPVKEERRIAERLGFPLLTEKKGRHKIASVFLREGRKGRLDLPQPHDLLRKKLAGPGDDILREYHQIQALARVLALRLVRDLAHDRVDPLEPHIERLLVYGVAADDGPDQYLAGKLVIACRRGRAVAGRPEEQPGDEREQGPGRGTPQKLMVLLSCHIMPSWMRASAIEPSGS